MEIAIVAGGCFWGVEHFMRRLEGVVDVESGYIGGDLDSPSYKDVKSGATGHAEAVKVTFDPKQVSYQSVIRLFFEIHDPEQVNRQGVDVGSQYRSEIFYLSEQQRVVALENIAILEAKGYKIATKVTAATTFYDAEEYHQDYTEKHNLDEPECHRYTKRF